MIDLDKAGEWTPEMIKREIKDAYLEGHRAGSAECICTFSQRMVGEGCQKCNPIYAAEFYVGAATGGE